jgi:hypothetical protein
LRTRFSRDSLINETHAHLQAERAIETAHNAERELQSVRDARDQRRLLRYLFACFKLTERFERHVTMQVRFLTRVGQTSKAQSGLLTVETHGCGW